ncbi:MAG: hypothetical protein QOE33_3297 [Acidobacteriota bacterium]|nr:hypothetical protein [Acidobacteriota bacterium]
MDILFLSSLTEIQPYFSTAAVLVNVATLGFVVNLANLIRNAKEDQIKLLEARNKAVQDEADARIKLLEKENQILAAQAKSVQADLDRTEKWHSRRVEELTQEMDGYKNQLKLSLTEAGINLESLILGQSSQNFADEIKQTVERTMLEMQGTLKEISDTTDLNVSINPDWYLELGKGFMAIREWSKAARTFDRYVHYRPLNWEVQFSRAVSYANSRQGDESNLSALRALNEAIVLAPTNDRNTDSNIIARLFVYRAAMLKRLNRLDEAEADLGIAKKIATDDYEVRDIKYNLACVYALRGDRAMLMSTIASIKTHMNYFEELAAIRNHLQDYFAAFASDEEFLNLISS